MFSWFDDIDFPLFDDIAPYSLFVEWPDVTDLCSVLDITNMLIFLWLDEIGLVFFYWSDDIDLILIFQDDNRFGLLLLIW